MLKAEFTQQSLTCKAQDTKEKFLSSGASLKIYML